LRIRVPLMLTFVTAIIMIVVFFTPHRLGEYVQTELNDWVMVIGGLGLVLGLISLLQRHLRKIAHRQQDWGYSVVAVASFLAMSVLGVGWGIQEGSVFYWVFRNIYAPLDATMFSILAFFVASAAFRTFRARSAEAALLLTAALIVMFGRVPWGQLVFKQSPLVAEWVMSSPALGAKRAILFGVSLGGIAMSLRIILGIERSHLGGEAG
jgi:dienelactone hydrolase